MNQANEQQSPAKPAVSLVERAIASLGSASALARHLRVGYETVRGWRRGHHAPLRRYVDAMRVVLGELVAEPADRKFCPDCGSYQPRDRFYASRHQSGGLSPYCKTHHNARCVAWQKKQRDGRRS